MAKRILFLGLGYTARAFAPRLDGWGLSASARAPDKAAALLREGVAPFAWTDHGLDPSAVDGADAILISASPTAQGCPAFAAAAGLVGVQAARLAWVGYLSATSVYGDHAGASVNEDSELRGISSRAQARLRAERQWSAHAAAHDYPLVIFRIAGIYGPGRSAIDTVRAGTAQRIDKPGHATNRIHVDDIATALKASLDNPGAGALFNLADDLPAPSHEVVAYACELLGQKPPPLVPFESARLSEAAKSFYTDDKRTDNARVKERLGVTLRYPTYKEGLRAIMAGA